MVISLSLVGLMDKTPSISVTKLGRVPEDVAVMVVAEAVGQVRSQTAYAALLVGSAKYQKLKVASTGSYQVKMPYVSLDTVYVAEAPNFE